MKVLELIQSNVTDVKNVMMISPKEIKKQKKEWNGKRNILMWSILLTLQEIRSGSLMKSMKHVKTQS